MHLRDYIPQLTQQTILVIGDVILDEYVIGQATRMSREAPVPVLEFESRRFIAGGAANPAANITKLGSYARQVGVIGRDLAGEQLVQVLADDDIDTTGLIVCDDRPTTVKTRIMAQMGLRFPQQVARIDTLSRAPIPSQIEDQLMAYVRTVSGVDAILLSHYHGGLLTESLMDGIRELSQTGVFVTADAQGDFDRFRQVDVVKCNADDAEAYLDRQLETDADFARAASELMSHLQLGRAMVITRGGDGATIATPDSVQHCAAPDVSDVFDTVGAGDTSIAVLTLALSAGVPAADAVMLANYASGIVVRHVGNYAPTPDELAQSILDGGL
jgi:rfaE bifunctional protein kinase chain/domain